MSKPNGDKSAKESARSESIAIYFTREMFADVDRVIDWLRRKYGAGNRSKAVALSLKAMVAAIDEGRPDYELPQVRTPK